MMKTRIFFSCFCLFLLLAVISSANAAENASSELRAGKMLMVGFRGTEISPKHHIWKDIQEHDLGGVILFDYDLESGEYGRNITGKKQLKRIEKFKSQLAEPASFTNTDKQQD